MNSATLWVLVVIIAASIAAVMIGRRASRSSFLRGRSRIDVDEISAPLPTAGASKVAVELIRAVGTAYRIDPGLLRLDDSLVDLAKLDSWDLGGGQERLEKWLRAQGLSSPLDQVRTLRDLVEHISNAQTK